LHRKRTLAITPGQFESVEVRLNTSNTQHSPSNLRHTQRLEDSEAMTQTQPVHAGHQSQPVVTETKSGCGLVDTRNGAVSRAPWLAGYFQHGILVQQSVEIKILTADNFNTTPK